MPAQMRKEIEVAVRAGRIDYVCATTTLAEGADLPFRTTDLEYLTHAWLERTGMYEVFSLLPTFEKSSANDDTRTKEFDKFIQLVEATWGSFLPWLFRACHQLAPFGVATASQLDWRDMARTLESRGTLEDIEIALVEYTPSD